MPEWFLKPRHEVRRAIFGEEDTPIVSVLHQHEGPGPVDVPVEDDVQIELLGVPSLLVDAPPHEVSQKA
eukprot:CAMPEP_0185774318 /NCGR_PEP_ID=MMETSP1174-20130828/77602_1 /TAXON_ID=35687 /ORGANISM="Dictyocha speculum, Strain CCMP1381" /LENGTH=68 /DNA_ID=CAMNT_0028461421 /DNA_START=286 /DNA_END=489 /DNA_ORIENTATION=+